MVRPGPDKQVGPPNDDKSDIGTSAAVALDEATD
jgi:hypothetical protein